MSEIEVGEYVRTTDGKIGIFDRYSSRSDTSYFKSHFNCFIKLKNRKTPLQCCREYIVKHSPNITDLIEVGDYVNGEKIIEVRKQDKKIFLFYDYVPSRWFASDSDKIKEILTHERYEQNSYKVVE